MRPVSVTNPCDLCRVKQGYILLNPNCTGEGRLVEGLTQMWGKHIMQQTFCLCRIILFVLHSEENIKYTAVKGKVKIITHASTRSIILITQFL